jgi:tRNA G18 (ribose-2'-O)-methylase SpoU
LENVRSLFNIGAIFRTCSFFGVENVILLGYTGRQNGPGSKELHKNVKKTALGSENDLTMLFIDSPHELVDFAKANKLTIIAFEQHPNSINFSNWSPAENSVLVFGNEVTGVSTELLDAATGVVEIPRKGKHNSLNVEVTCAIALAKL